MYTVFFRQGTLFPKPRNFDSNKKLGEKYLLPTRQQGTVLTLGNQTQLGKGGRKQGESGCSRTEKALGTQQ